MATLLLAYFVQVTAHVILMFSTVFNQIGILFLLPFDHLFAEWKNLVRLYFGRLKLDKTKCKRGMTDVTNGLALLGVIVDYMVRTCYTQYFK